MDRADEYIGARLEEAWEWAVKAQHEDPLAAAYAGICLAIGAIGEDPINASPLFLEAKEDIGEDAASKLLCGLDETLGEFQRQAAIEVREEMALLINSLLLIKRMSSEDQPPDQ